MAVCKDPSLTFLNKLGYNVVRLPREGIAPLDVLGRDGKSLERLGRLDQIWTSDEAVPSAGAAQAVGNVNGQKTDDLKLSIGLKVLENIIRGMTGGSASLKVGYQRARSVQFTYTDAQAERIDAFAVGRYLSEGDLNTNNPFVARYFQAEETEAYVITEVLKSPSITVTAKDKSGAAVEVDVPVIQQAVGGSVSVSAENDAGTDVTYTGPTPLVFGFKVFGIGFLNGSWTVHGEAPSGDLAFAAPGAPPPSVIFSDGGLVSLNEGS